MENHFEDLSHRWKPNVRAERELRRARIEIERDMRPQRIVDHLVAVTGKLGSFLFRRSQHYWIADGRMPLRVAEELYLDPIGVEDIRVNENPDCPPPAYHLVFWETKEGRRVLSSKEMKQQKKLIQDGVLPDSVLDNFVESDTPEDIGALGFIIRYAIVSEVGLRVFADTLRNHGLATAPSAPLAPRAV